MHDDELAAVIAAAMELLRRTPAPEPPAASRWLLAARLGRADVTTAQTAGRRSRWSLRGRLS
jgi:hypothetical protein